MSLPAEIVVVIKTDARGAVRRTLRLRVHAQVAGDGVEAEIRNLSESGLLVETMADLLMGEVLHFDLPEAEHIEATVVWSRGRIFGCEFKDRLPKGAVSAAMLRSANERSGQDAPALAATMERPEEGSLEASIDDYSIPAWVIGLGGLMLVVLIVLYSLFER